MKASFFLFVMLLFIGSSMAQTVTKAKLKGKWKPIAIESNGRRYSIADEPMLRSILRTLSPQTAAKGDSAQMKKSARLLYELYNGIMFDFRNDSIVHVSTPNVNGKGEMENEEDDVVYGLAGNNLLMNADSAKPDKIALSMPDPRTLIFVNFGPAGGNSLVFKKQ
ncbi:MAG: hypothetical protein JWO03_2933 [Bacteroidetes bacterium]|nr:hypothetical protein [Bacteroidota bacterium]